MENIKFTDICPYCFLSPIKDPFMLHFDPNVQIQHAACKKCVLLSYHHIKTQNDPDEYRLYPLPPCPFCREPTTTQPDLQPCEICTIGRHCSLSSHMKQHTGRLIRWSCLQRLNYCPICKIKYDFSSPFA